MGATVARAPTERRGPRAGDAAAGGVDDRLAALGERHLDLVEVARHQHAPELALGLGAHLARGVPARQVGQHEQADVGRGRAPRPRGRSSGASRAPARARPRGRWPRARAPRPRARPRARARRLVSPVTTTVRPARGGPDLGGRTVRPAGGDDLAAALQDPEGRPGLDPRPRAAATSNAPGPGSSTSAKAYRRTVWRVPTCSIRQPSPAHVTPA